MIYFSLNLILILLNSLHLFTSTEWNGTELNYFKLGDDWQNFDPATNSLCSANKSVLGSGTQQSPINVDTRYVLKCIIITFYILFYQVVAS